MWNLTGSILLDEKSLDKIGLDKIDISLVVVSSWEVVWIFNLVLVRIWNFNLVLVRILNFSLVLVCGKVRKLLF